jgi:cobalt-zinc-cadmium efflux system outer membrane protein
MKIVYGFCVSVCLLTAEAASVGAAAPANTTNAPVKEIAIDALVTEGLANNPELKHYEAELIIARAEAKSAGRLAPPELEAGAGHQRAHTRGGDFLGEGVAWSVSVKQPIEWPGRLGLRKAIANRDVALAEIGLAQFRSIIAASIRSTAQELAIAQQRVAATRPVAQRLRRLRETLVARDPAGLAPLLETRVIEATEIKADHAAAEAEHDLEHLVIALNYLRGQPPTTPVRVSEKPFTFNAAPALDALLAAAATNNFDLRLRQAELEQQGFRIQLARHERFPGISIGPVFSEERAADRERIVGLAISAPLPLWQNNRARVEAARAREAQALASIETVRRRLERDVADYAHKHEHALSILGRWRTDAIDHFREAAELADRHYRLGAVPVATYVELQRQYVDAVETLLDAHKEALTAAHQLELLTGLHLISAGAPPQNETK